MTSITPLTPTPPMRPPARPPTFSEEGDSFRRTGHAPNWSPAARERPKQAPGKPSRESFAPPPPPTPMAQAQAVVAQAHALISQMGNSNAPIGVQQAQQLVAIIDATAGQLMAIGQAGG
ncbi:MAG TPA: hypothetical protein VGO93_13035, partial [Candidatus Xenobia bacterium]